MITAMATGTVLVVLPMIVDRCKELLNKHKMERRSTLSTVDVMVPTAYSFPSTGTLLGLGFILFSAWYVGSPLGLEQYPSYVVMGGMAWSPHSALNDSSSLRIGTSRSRAGTGI